MEQENLKVWRNGKQYTVISCLYKIIKQLFHACSGNSQNYWPEVLEMTWELLPEAEQAWNNCILFLVPSDFQIFLLHAYWAGDILGDY
jgi:hypothetical protein